MLNTESMSPDSLSNDLLHFIRNPSFPCVGAKSAVAKQKLEIMTARSITSAWDDLAICQRLLAFAKRPLPTRDFTSFAVIFDTPRTLDEAGFERSLWQRVQSISDKDRWLGQSYDQSVSADPTNPHFSLSFGGRAFFVVGLHPRASRKARRFRAPAMIFNLHAQFERLRADDRYEKLRSTILARDLDYSGSVNPMLARHGSVSEARQYSGREVSEAWRCPFAYKGEIPGGILDAA